MHLSKGLHCRNIQNFHKYTKLSQRFLHFPTLDSEFQVAFLLFIKRYYFHSILRRKALGLDSYSTICIQVNTRVTNRSEIPLFMVNTRG